MSLNVAHILLYDREKRFLLQHRTSDAKHLPGYWGFFGGSIDVKETPENAVKRETLEELNYKLKAPILVLEQNFVLKNAYGYMYIFVEAFNGDKKRLKLMEGQGWGWFNENEVNKLKITDSDQNIIQTIASYLRNNEKK